MNDRPARLMAARAAFLAIVVLTAACARIGAGGPSSSAIGAASPSPSPRPTPAASVAPPSAEPSSDVASEPPTSPTEAPEPELLVRVLATGHIVDRLETWDAAISTDGRAVWTDPDASEPRAYRAGWLSPAGLAEVRAALETERALVPDASYELAPTGTESPGHGRSWWTIELGSGDGSARVLSEILQDGTEAYVQHTPETERLDRLATRLVDPESWLGPDAWASAPAAFRPDTYLVSLTLRDYHPEFPSGTTFDEIAPPFDPRTVGDPAADGTRCAILAAAEIEPVIGRLNASVGEWAAATIDWPQQELTIDLVVLPILAPATPSCA